MEAERKMREWEQQKMAELLERKAKKMGAEGTVESAKPAPPTDPKRLVSPNVWFGELDNKEDVEQPREGRWGSALHLRRSSEYSKS